MRLLHLVAAMLVAVGSCPAAARADVDSELFDLLMVWESISICKFPIGPAQSEKLDAAIIDDQDQLGRSEAEMGELHDEAAWSILRQKPAMCAQDGSWRQRYDQILTTLQGGLGGG